MYDLNLVATLNLNEIRNKKDETRENKELMLELVFGHFAPDDG